MKELDIRHVKQVKTSRKDVFAFEIPPGAQDALWHMVSQLEEYGITHYRIRLSQPYKPRSTGPHSQCNRINGFIQQIAVETGNDFDVLKTFFKRLALSHDYPFDTDPEGEPVPRSESKLSTTEAGYLIETIEQWAAENGIALKEVEE